MTRDIPSMSVQSKTRMEVAPFRRPTSQHSVCRVVNIVGPPSWTGHRAIGVHLLVVSAGNSAGPAHVAAYVRTAPILVRHATLAETMSR